MGKRTKSGYAKSSDENRRTQLRLEKLEDRSVPTAAPGSIELEFIGRFQSGLGAENSEIVAYDPATRRIFTNNSSTKSVDIIDISNPSAPFKTGSISFASGTNGVAVKNGIVAVAVEAPVKTDLGSVAFYNTNGVFLHQVTVGSLPDMVTFTPDGKKLLVANEGEPNSYNQATSVDPEGSVSIIDLSNGVMSATVTNVRFNDFNIGGSRHGELNPNILIYGPNASVAQDLEPEYITTDGVTAWVTLQENNAIAIINVATASVTQLVSLGFKDYSQSSPFTESYTFQNMPLLGTVNGEQIPLGGFSGLVFEGYDASGNLKFITHTDRGPNGEPVGINRPFLIPDFNPEIIRFTLNRLTGQLSLTQRLQLKKPDGTALTGLSNINFSTNANLAYNDEIPVDANFNPLNTFDSLGADLEGIVVDPNDGTFWMVDEYRPAIYHFATDGTMIDRFIPEGTHAAAGVAYVPGTFGVFGTEALPAVLAQRRQNRGFEAVAFQNGKVYAMVQSPLRNPISSSNTALNSRQTVRLVEFDPATKATRQFLYQMDNTSIGATRSDKIGDMTSIPGGGFLVVERDDDLVPSSPVSDIEKKIYKFNLTGATPITPANDILYSGKTLDEMTLAELTAAGIVPIAKTLHTDLAKVGYNTVSKVEGLTIIDAGTIAVINDNDFQVGAANEPIVLGLIRTNVMDPSDRDNGSNGPAIRLNNWPVFGMYQPDAIASFVVNGQTYLITANEGDARDYTGFAEEIRVGAGGYVLDPTVFPNAATLKNNANLGRLTVTTTLGNSDGDGDFDKIYTLGGRSFSIWTASGQLVFDSGSDLEVITSTLFPTLFNSEGTAAGFDTRSDNKGPEPEGVTVGVVNGKTYAFVALERIGGIMVYDVSQPTMPKFVQYVTSVPGDLAPEGTLFISAADSPIGRPLVVTGNEVTATTAIFQVTEADLRYEAPAGPVGNNMVLRKNGADVELIDSATNTILLRQSLAATSSITVVGRNTEAESLTIDFAFGGAFDLAGGVDFTAGTGLGDLLRLIGTPGDDTIFVGSGSMNDLEIDWTGVESFELDGRAGNDRYRLATTNARVRVYDNSGIDTLDFSSAHAGVQVDLSKTSGQKKRIDSTGNDLHLYGVIENLIGSAYADTLKGSAVDNYINGGAGNDRIDGDSGNDILLGGGGSDDISGGAGRDILIGGLAGDNLKGDSGDDLLIGGATSHDDNLTALNEIRAEWTSTRTYAERVQNLREGTGTAVRANGSTYLSVTTVPNDGASDKLLGGSDRDWFFRFFGDFLPDLKNDEWLN